MALKLGDQVRLIQPIIEGEVVDAALDKETLTTRYMVRWTDQVGDVVERYFDPSEIEVIASPE